MASKPMAIQADPHPFVKAFPTTAATVRFSVAVLRLFGVVVSRLWPYRRELVLTAGLLTAWSALSALLPASRALLVAVAASAGLVAVPAVRVWLGRWLRGGRTRRWL